MAAPHPSDRPRAAAATPSSRPTEPAISVDRTIPGGSTATSNGRACRRGGPKAPAGRRSGRYGLRPRRRARGRAGRSMQGRSRAVGGGVPARGMGSLAEGGRSGSAGARSPLPAAGTAGAEARGSRRRRPSSRTPAPPRPEGAARPARRAGPDLAPARPAGPAGPGGGASARHEPGRGHARGDLHRARAGPRRRGPRARARLALLRRRGRRGRGKARAELGAQLRAYLADRVLLHADGAPCPPTAPTISTQGHTVHVRTSFACGDRHGRLELESRLLAGADPGYVQHVRPSAATRWSRWCCARVPTGCRWVHRATRSASPAPTSWPVCGTSWPAPTIWRSSWDCCSGRAGPCACSRWWPPSPSRTRSPSRSACSTSCARRCRWSTRWWPRPWSGSRSRNFLSRDLDRAGR